MKSSTSALILTTLYILSVDGAAIPDPDAIADSLAIPVDYSSLDRFAGEKRDCARKYLCTKHGFFDLCCATVQCVHLGTSYYCVSVTYFRR